MSRSARGFLHNKSLQFELRALGFRTELRAYLICLCRFVVTCSFRAWSPGDRDHPERRISISPGSKDLFTDKAERSGEFVKFLKNGSWYEAERRDFERATVRELAAKT